MPDGLGPVGHLLGLWTALQDRLTDQGRVFRARIVIGDNDVVGLVGGDHAHLGALRRVTVAAAAKDHDDPATRVRAGGAQKLVETIGCMRIINQDRSLVSRFTNLLEPPGNAAQCFQAGQNARLRDTIGQCNGGRAERVEDLELTDQRDIERVIRAAPGEDHALAGRARCDLSDGQVTAAPPQGQNLETTGTSGVGHLATPLAVDIDHGPAGRQETLGKEL